MSRPFSHPPGTLPGAEAVHVNLDALRPSRWYAAALVGFLGGLVCGLMFAVSGPVPFMRALGAGIVMVSALGLALSAAGFRLEDPRAFSTAVARARDKLATSRRGAARG